MLHRSICHGIRKNGFGNARRQFVNRECKLEVACRATSSAYGKSNSSPRSDYASVSSNGPSSNPGDGPSAASTSSNAFSPDQVQRIEQLRELVQETIRISMSTGPRGFFRAVQAAQSVASLAAEYFAKGSVDPLPVFLRKLFEKLGKPCFNQ